MSSLLQRAVRPVAENGLRRRSSSSRGLTTQLKSKKEGDISSVFVSLSGAAATKLPDRFTDIKRDLIRGNEEKLTNSWKRLLKQLAVENRVVAAHGPNVVPQIEYEELSKPSDQFMEAVNKRGVAVIRGVVPEAEARGYKGEVEEYVRANPWTKGRASRLSFSHTFVSQKETQLT
jgi:Protein of unknown function (DUF1479)